MRELKAEGLSDAKIAKALNSESYLNSKGKPFTASGVWTCLHQSKENLTDISDKSGISDAMREEIRQIVQQEIQAAMKSQTLQKDQIEPAPVLDSSQKVIDTATKRKVAPVKRPKIAGTVDAELMRRFEAWRKEKGLTLSSALDTALWHFLGKPSLSFQITDKSDNGEQ